MQVAVQSCAGESKQPHYRWWSVINGMLMFEYSAERGGWGRSLGWSDKSWMQNTPSQSSHKEEMGKKENGKKKQLSLAKDQIIC